MISALLLAAGQSKRIKEKNKLLLKYKGKPLINHILSSLIKSKVKKIIVVLGHENNKIKKKTIKSKKIKFVFNKSYKKGISSSIKYGLKGISKNSKGFMIVHSDMPYIKTSHINKIVNSLLNNNDQLVHVLKYRSKIGNPIGFDISLLRKFRKIKGDFGAKFMVKRLTKKTNFIKVTSNKIFKDFDLFKDFH